MCAVSMYVMSYLTSTKTSRGVSTRATKHSNTRGITPDHCPCGNFVLVLRMTPCVLPLVAAVSTDSVLGEEDVEQPGKYSRSHIPLRFDAVPFFLACRFPFSYRSVVSPCVFKNCTIILPVN